MLTYWRGKGYARVISRRLGHEMASARNRIHWTSVHHVSAWHHTLPLGYEIQASQNVVSTRNPRNYSYVTLCGNICIEFSTESS